MTAMQDTAQQIFTCFDPSAGSIFVADPVEQIPSAALRPEDHLAPLNPAPDLNFATLPLSFNGGSDPVQLIDFRPVTSGKRWEPLREIFRVLQKWEGFVVEVQSETFLARLVPIKGEGPDQEAEIYIREVQEADIELIKPGAVFYWTIGYHDKPSGRVRSSIIKFRRQPIWTNRDLEAATARADYLMRLFNEE